MLQKKAQVVSESILFKVFGGNTLNYLFDKGGKPLQNLSETMFRAAGTTWGPSVFFLSLSKALAPRM